MWKKVYVQILNVLFWMQSIASFGVVAIFWSTEIIRVSSKNALLQLEDLLFLIGLPVVLTAPLFWLAALLFLLRGPGLSAEKHAASAGAPVIVFIHMLFWYWGHHC